MSPDVVIVGGGIGGLYAAYRLREAWRSDSEQHRIIKEWLGIQRDALDVIILERNPVMLGGRIRTAELPVPPRAPGQNGNGALTGGAVLAELGAMRVTTRHLLARRLLRQLGIRTVPFEGEGFTEHFYLRGKHFDIADIEIGHAATFPYTLADEEKGKTPGALVEDVLEKTVQEITLDKDATAKTLMILEKLRSKNARATLGYEDWCEIQEHGLLTGRVHLKNIGMWNLIHHYLSPEAASFVDGGFGYESIIGNWNVSDAIPWFIADFSPKQGYEAVVGSFYAIVERIRDDLLASRDNFNCEIVMNRQVTTVNKDDHGYSVTAKSFCEDRSGDTDTPTSLHARAVILALPRGPLESVEYPFADAKSLQRFQNDLVSVRPHRLVKIAQAYDKAWWRQAGSRPGSASRTFTDLPLRQVYYYDREWLAERGRYRDENGQQTDGKENPIGGLIVAYLDGHYTSFWRFITAVQRAGAKPPDEEQRRRWFGDRVWHWPEPSYEPPSEEHASQWRHDERVVHLYFHRYGLYERASTKVKHTLELLHKAPAGSRRPRVSIPEPLAGAYTFWDDHSDDSLSGAGWHTWEPGVDSDKVMERMVCPFDQEKVYVCGEAYSNEQGWSEGALKSVERIMYHLGLPLPDEMSDPNAPEMLKRRSEAMFDHVGVRPRKHKEEPVKPRFDGHRTVRIGDCEEMVFMAGKIGLDPENPGPLTFEAEAERAIQALFDELAAANGTPSDFIEVRVFLLSMDNYDAFNRIYNRKFENIGNTAPVRTAIAVGALPRGARVEVDGIAVIRRPK